ncbi:MAG: adenine phosphoribosyltransferase [Lachnospirales bacterium]
MDLKKVIRSVEDFPEKGILFRDITTVLMNENALVESVDEMQKKVDGCDFDLIIGPESRGFIFGMPLAYNLKKGFIPVRKKGKLPYETISESYNLEYGSATVEMHKDAIKKGQKVVIVDDLLATGGTCKAMVNLIEKAGGEVVKIVFFIELDDLKGRKVLEGYSVESVLNY